MAVKGPSRKRQTGTIITPGKPPQNIELLTDEQYIVKGWEDITADLSTGKTPAANAPTWSVFRDGIYAYAFSDSATNSLFITFHITHDYAHGTKVYPHIHWSPGNSTNTGVVRWGFEYSVQKGHQQGNFPATTTVYVEDNNTTGAAYEHRIAEFTDAQAFDALETDALILCRIFRDGGHANDTFTGDAFGLTADIHYQVDKQVTPNRAPPFFR